MNTTALMHQPGRLLLRNWWVFVLTAGSVIATAAFLTARQPDVYQSRATMILRPDRGLGSVDHIVDSLRMIQPRQVIATFAKMPGSRALSERIQEETGRTAAELRKYRIRCSVLPDTYILSLTVEHSDPASAVEMAEIVLEQTKQYAKSVYRIFGLTVLDPPAERPSRVKPRMERSLTAATVVGVLSGLALAFLVGTVREWGRSRAGAGEPDER